MTPGRGTGEPRTKIFGIGLNKTATSSLHQAFTSLGIRSLHFGGPPVRRRIEETARQQRPLVDDFPEYDAFSDIVYLSKKFRVLDRQYPGSKFILTTRDMDSWLDSRRRHVERNIELARQGLYDRDFLTVDYEAWTEEWREHHEAVFEYFADRAGDFLVMDIPAGDGYEVLCPFLGYPIPDHAFPWSNRGSDEHGGGPRRASLARRWRRRLRAPANRIRRLLRVDT
jgi:hypothetical protein